MTARWIERIGMHRFSGAMALIVTAALAASGCGGGGDEKPGPDQGKAKIGGELTFLSAGDVSSLDPGVWYYNYDYEAIGHPTQRALYGWKPGDVKPSPDLATSLPKTSADGKTVTITLRPDIHYSPPLQDRVVKSADVKYALERAFLPSVQCPYAAVYYSDIVGATSFASGKATEITGIQTPDDTTLVLKLKNPVGVISNGESLSLPATIAVPKDYAAKYDKQATSSYGRHQVFTGPYMISNDGKGNVTGYKTNRRLELVRNPSWKASTDYRPAYLDKVVFLAGNDIDIASRRILSGKSLANGDISSPPVNLLRSAVDTRADQLAFAPSGGNRYISLNTTVKPFDNVDVRRAAAAAINKNALRLTRGGAKLGPIATHFVGPGIGGFEEAGGAAGTFDFTKNPDGDLKLAEQYMKKAGYASGKYSGPPLLMVGDNELPGSRTGEAVQAQLEQLGFKFDYRQTTRTTTFANSCASSTAKVAVCPNGGFQKDFFDPQSLLDPAFNGKNIAPVNSPNWSNVNDPEVNEALEMAVRETDPASRARDYGDIDKMVTGRAYVITWLWDDQINFASDNVRGVVNTFDATWDVSFTSLK
jgi:peptide/nickel transport system substrate-binding protein